MTPTIRNIIAIFAGVAAGMIVNMGIVTLGGNFIAPPEGVDPNDLESIKSNIRDYGPQHFIVPFLAHALGTLVGAYTAVRLSASKKMAIGLGVGAFFLLGGIAMVTMIPNSPLWFTITDLGFAYFPMGWLGWKLAKGQ